MYTIDGLMNYCELEKPVGALLLSGEWGCGKTYLINNTLKEKLQKTHIIIRISLFGLTSIAELHDSVKNEWINKAGGYRAAVKKVEGLLSHLRTLEGVLPEGLPKGLARGVFSFNFTRFFKISRTIEDKKVVLVFDDLERSKITVMEILGAINEYCENQGFNVIVVADEGRIKKEEQTKNSIDSQSISFQDIKEKVIQQTIYYEADYRSVVESVIVDSSDGDYRRFLLDNKENIIQLLAGKNEKGENLDIDAKKHIYNIEVYGKKDEKDDREKKAYDLMRRRPHNIRSLKAALQNFSRVYSILMEYHVDDSYKWLFSFLAFSMAEKANLIDLDEYYKSLFSNRDMLFLYPGYFSSQYFPEALALWVTKGRWNENELREYLNLHYSTDENVAVSLVRSSRIEWIDEDVISEGIIGVTQEAYEGKLSYDQYIMFIVNNKVSRAYNLSFPSVDWHKVQHAILQKIEDDINNEEYDSSKHYQISYIREEELNHYTEDEVATYRLLEQLDDVIGKGKNRCSFIREIKDKPDIALVSMQNKFYKYFDLEMAKATIEGYKKANNMTRARFPESFLKTWGTSYEQYNIPSEDDILITKGGFEYLKKELDKLIVEYVDKPIKKHFTEEFLETVKELCELRKK